MSYKKHNWAKYGGGGEFIEIIIKGQRGGKIDFFKTNNKEEYKKILQVIKDKYGYEYPQKEQFNIKKQVEEEINFLDKNRSNTSII